MQIICIDYYKDNLSRERDVTDLEREDKATLPVRFGSRTLNFLLHYHISFTVGKKLNWIWFN